MPISSPPTVEPQHAASQQLGVEHQDHGSSIPAPSMPGPFARSRRRATIAIRRLAMRPPVAVPSRPTVEPLTLLMVAALLAGCAKPQPEPPLVRSVKTTTVAAASPQLTQTYSGEVRAQVESRLGFRVAGKISRRMVDAGQAVRAGQPLMELDASDYRLAQDAAQAQLAAARAERDQTSADYKRYAELHAQGFIGAAELERRRTALQAAQARLDQAQAQATGQSNQTRYSVLLADADGIVTGVDAEPGQVVSAGTPVLRLARRGPRDVVFAVPEDRVGRLAVGMPVKVRTWAQPDRAVDAVIRELAAAADPATRTFTAKAALPSDEALKLGMTATVEWTASNIDVASLRLPLSALVQHQGKPAVWIWDAATRQVQPREVRVAATEGNDVLLASGLEPGQVVVTAGTHVLQPGMTVKPLAGDAAHKAGAAPALASASQPAASGVAPR
jgi:RND family efflux transporter MFP subunit